MSDDLVREIERLVARVGGRQEVGLSSAAFGFESTPPPQTPFAHSSLGQGRQRCRWKPWRGRSNSLLSDSSGRASSTRDDGASSVASDPTTLTTPSIASDDVFPTLFWIPCDFSQYGGCRERFNMIPDFVAHSLQHHGPLLPSTSICWFCDEWIFHTSSDRTDMRVHLYSERLSHIGDHYRLGDPGRIRPDHFVLSHLKPRIDDDIFETLWHQEPRRVVELDRSLYTSPEDSTDLVVQIAGSGRHRRRAPQKSSPDVFKVRRGGAVSGL